MKLKNIVSVVALSTAVIVGICGCGPSEDEKKEVYDSLGTVEQKYEKIEKADLDMRQGFQEKWDLLGKQLKSAKGAFSKNDYNATLNFLQEAESAADWILEKAPQREEAARLLCQTAIDKQASESVSAEDYASSIYSEAVEQVQNAYHSFEKADFIRASQLCSQAVKTFSKAHSIAEAWNDAKSNADRAKSSADEISASQFASTIYSEAESQVKLARSANRQGRYDEALRLLSSAKETFSKAQSTAEAWNDAKSNADRAKSSADEISASQFASTIYSEAVSQIAQARSANRQGRYDEALRLLSSAKETFEKSVQPARVPAMIASMVKVEAGRFQRGKEQVTLTKDFLIGKYEVTQAQWKAVMGNNPSEFKGSNRPVENVNWHDAMKFCEVLNDGGFAPAGWKFTLPTEAQWEYAARGGKKNWGYKYSGSNDLDEVGWYKDNSGGQTHDVGGKKPNELGIYDMSGNVEEWCLDWYGDYSDGAVTDPQGPESGSSRVLRGGSWRDYAYYCHVAYRGGNSPDNRGNYDGFRLALVPGEVEKARRAEAQRQAEAAEKLRANSLTFDLNGVELKMILLKAGTFNMGSENGDSDEKPVHRVTLTKDYYLGQYEVTQAQYQAIMGNNPSYFKGDIRQVERVSWNDAMAFCKKLNDSGKAPEGWKFTLPTEAQWEFAARGGNKSKGYTYSGSNDVKDVAWYLDNSGGQTHDVGGKKPNELGIYDMSGNVYEWCLDRYGDYDYGAVTDPQGPESGSYRVLRGGSWYSRANYCHVASRRYGYPGSRNRNYGFRLALVPVQ